MKINRTQGYCTNFTSDVFISSNVCLYETGNGLARELLCDEKFQQELNKLRQNGNKDTVLLTNDENLNGLNMTITEKIANHVKVIRPFGVIRRASDVDKLYNEGKEGLKKVEGETVPKAIVDYVI